jgi:hypothetical protein
MNQGIAQEISQVMPVAYALGTFVALASFFAPSQIQLSTGNYENTQTPIAGLQNIPCMNAPAAAGVVGLSSDETRLIPHIEAERHRHILLNAYFQALDTGFNQGAGLGWQLQVTNEDGTTETFDFLGGEGDSQQTQTRVKAQLVTV